MQYERISFAELNLKARASALQQMADINQQEQLHKASTADEFSDMIVDGYEPDRDFMFLLYPNDSVDNVTVYLKDFS